jgi:hypothetical protein
LAKAAAIVFWIGFSLSALLLVAWSLDRGGDAATRGLGKLYALLGLPFLVVGLAVFLFAHGTLGRGLAVRVAAVPLLLMGLMAANARFGYIVDEYLRSPAHIFGGSAGRELGRAIEAQDLARIKSLAAGGADLNGTGREDIRPLSFALDRNKLDAARVLLELGADPTRGRGEAGRPPLVEIASSDALAELLVAALAHGADPNYVFSPESGTLVYWAIASRARRNMEQLVASGARLDLRDDAHFRSSPLSYALQRRLWDYALFLVEHGAPLSEAPGYNGLQARFANADPPGQGDADHEQYVLLVRAMSQRGFAPGRR